MLLRKTVPCLISWLALSSLAAQEVPELLRRHCWHIDRANKCPGSECLCVDDALEVTFDGGTTSVLEYDDFTPGSTISVTVVLDVKGPTRSGWSYGIRHDQSFLTLDSAATPREITDLSNDGFNQVSLEVEDCGSDPRCLAPVAGGGYVTAVVLSLNTVMELPAGRNSISRADYTLIGDPGPAGTIIEVSQLLRRRFSPPTDINLSVEGQGREPTYLVDGWVRRRGLITLFRRGDANSDGVMNLTDAMFIFEFLFSGGTNPPCMEAADYDGNDTVQQTDAINLLSWLFLGVRSPVLPGPPPDPCGPSRMVSLLGCDSYTACSGP